ncbi:helix-turn-helix transcriptional regulator [Lachnospiraceae bacterium 62-35]
MNVREATCRRIRELCTQKDITEYTLIYRSGIPPSTFKSIMNGQSKNPGITNIRRIADGLDISIREFYDSDMFDDLDQEDED